MTSAEKLRFLEPATENMEIARRVIAKIFPGGIQPPTFWGEGRHKNIPYSDLHFTAVRAFKPLVVVSPEKLFAEGRITIHPDSTPTNVILSTPNATIPNTIISFAAKFGYLAQHEEYFSRFFVVDSYFQVPHFTNDDGTGMEAGGFVLPVSETGQQIAELVEDPNRVLMHIALIGNGSVLNTLEDIHGLVVLKQK